LVRLERRTTLRDDVAKTVLGLSIGGGSGMPEPSEALSLSAGDELLVLSKPDRVVIVPKPKKFAKRMAGLHREVWRGAEAYLQDERKDW
jgi:hypothetical protein